MAVFSKKQPDIPRRRQQQATSASSERPSEIELAQRYAFKRNRTLTGSASSQVTSTNESGAHLKSARVQAHELARQRRRIASILGIVIVGVLSLYGLVSQFTAEVVVRTSDATQQLDPLYAEAVDSYLAQHPIERLRFMLHENALSTHLQSIVPEVAAIERVESAGFGASRFIVEMRRPIAGWTIRQTQQYVDATGTSFTRNYFATPTVQIVDNSGIQVETGDAVASNQFLGFVGRVVGLARVYKHDVTEVVIPQGTTRQMELHLEGVTYPIKLSIDRSAGEQVEDMTHALQWLDEHERSPEYLDVRVSGRAFYRL